MRQYIVWGIVTCSALEASISPKSSIPWIQKGMYVAMDTSLNENRVTYRRRVSDLKSWLRYTPEHVAFALHRITGWLLLGWVGLHLAIPVLEGGNVYVPESAAMTVFVIAVLVFHGFNGIRLIAAELFGVGISQARRVFYATLIAAAALVIITGVTL